MIKYEYMAKIINVVDGDTVDAMVDLGFGHYQKVRFRLDGVDTPEKNSTNPEEVKAAKIAEKFLEDLVLDKYFYIRSSKGDSWGRWIAKIFIDEEKTVSDLIIESGHGKIYEGRK